MAKRIDGKVISKQIKDELKEEVAQLKAKGIEGSLAVIQVGNDPTIHKEVVWWKVYLLNVVSVLYQLQ